MFSDRPSEAMPEPQRAIGSGAVASFQGLRVFIAEDEPMLLWALEEILADLGCTVVGTAALVTEALAFVAHNPFDVAILDGALTDGNIDPVVKLLVARGTPFLIASGLTTFDMVTRFGSAVTLQKPYKDIALQHALRAALK